ncbi:dephospho-CoA kinase [uncultured Pseudokineococcus sp.]|uniref:dephospho-CoA kinase n=1 Tax=uncultured Pseudokineococcus sp. TaxID=1642928 RepID=UPI00262051EA|nr:dephospho-CoA kinase [uncultured Pseudokineococcus sp.]
MLRVGLTGGTGAGKSTAARRLSELGAVVVDADAIAREVVEPGTPGLDAVVREFGEHVLTGDGALDRPALGAVVFADADRRRALEAITHPLVRARREELVAAAPASAVVVDDIPLLVETGRGAEWPLVVVVDAPVEVRVARLVASRGMAEADARARIASQAGDDERRAAADVVLANDGGAQELREAVEQLWRERLVPFEEGLRLGRRAARDARAVLVPPDPTWPAQAERVLARVRRAAGERALSVEHVGSTSVPGLPAKDVLDVQVVVDDLATAQRVADDLREAGLVRLPGEWADELPGGGTTPKCFAANADPERAVNCHVRPRVGRASDVLALRDHLRAHPAERAAYAALKARLAAEPHASVDEYASRKGPWIRAALERARATG